MKLRSEYQVYRKTGLLGSKLLICWMEIADLGQEGLVVMTGPFRVLMVLFGHAYSCSE